jgi:inhibitor of KinA
VRDLGDVPAYILADGARALKIKGVTDVVSAYDTLGVYVDPLEFDEPGLLEALSAVAERNQGKKRGKLHRVPVCYDLGEDLESSAEELGLSAEEFVQQHSGRPYTCYAVGFVPGFPYLGYLPVRICGLSRLPAPRLVVPAGAVGVAGDQTGVYPNQGPGGWRLVGATPLTIVDVADGYFPIAAGDQVSFDPITLGQYESLKGERL